MQRAFPLATETGRVLTADPIKLINGGLPSRIRVRLAAPKLNPQIGRTDTLERRFTSPFPDGGGAILSPAPTYTTELSPGPVTVLLPSNVTPGALGDDRRL